MKIKNLTLNISVIILMLLMVQTLNACTNINFNSKKGSGVSVAEDRVVKSFNAIDISGGFEVILIQGTTEALRIEADDNLIRMIVTEVRGNELKIYTDGNVSPKTKMRAYITFATLDEIEISGAVSVIANEKLMFDKLSIDGSGASEIKLEISLNNLEVELSGASELNLSGSAKSATYDCSGASEIKAFDFKTAESYFDLSGASEAEVWVTEVLKVDCSGASDIKYKGDPMSISTDTSGASSVHKIK